MNRVFMICSEFPPLPGGIGNHAYNVVRQMVKRGYHCKVLTNRRSRPESEEEFFEANIPGVPVISIPRSRLLFVTYLQRLFVFLKILRHRSDNDIIFLSGKFSLWMAAFLKKNGRGNFIAILHGSELHYHGVLSRLLMKKGLANCRSIVAVSSYTSSKAMGMFPAYKEKITVINNGFDESRSRYVRGPKDTHEGIRLVTVGNVHPRKGQQNVIESLPGIRSEIDGITYDMIGIPSYRDQFQELASRLGVADIITFRGVLTDEELDDQLGRYDIFCMLSEELPNGDFEGFGIAVVEANATGLPAIGSKNSGIADAIKDGFSGILVNPHDPADIAHAIGTIMKDYNGFHQRALEWSKRFSWADVASQYIELMAEKSPLYA